MIQTLKKLILRLSIVSLIAFPVLAPVTVHAVDTQNVQQNLCAGANLDVNNTDCSTGDPSGRVNGILATTINIFSLVVGVIAVIMIIVGGLKYITSGGESANITGAKNTILYAIIGLVVVALAQFIVRFVLTKVNSGG